MPFYNQPTYLPTTQKKFDKKNLNGLFKYGHKFDQSNSSLFAPTSKNLGLG
jgi:hypothetical protein